MSQNHTPIHDLVSKHLSSQVDDTSDYFSPSSSIPENISLSKEAGPTHTSTSELLPINEAVEKQEVDSEVQPFIDVKQQNMKVEPELKKLGLQPIEKTKYADYQNIALPLPDDKIISGLKAPDDSSFRWLATFAQYVLEKSHLTLKFIRGKVVRVVKK